MPSFCIRDFSVERLIPSRAAAPFGPPMVQLICSSAATICFVSCESSDKLNLQLSSHDLVSQTAVHGRADLLFCGKMIWNIWKSGIDLARLVECLNLFARERQVEARKIILQLRRRSCPDDGDDRHGAVAEPCQRDLRHAAAGLIRYRLDGRDDTVRPLLLGHEILHRVAVQAALLG
jgi:hypothetical protein